MGADGTDKNKKKIRRLGKKKVFLVAALVAVFVGALGVTAVGEKNYFFRGRSRDINDLVFNNDKNKIDVSKLEEAYKIAEDELNFDILKLRYIPSDLQLKELEISNNRVIFQFEYKGNQVYFVQSERDDSASVTAKSDRSIDMGNVNNKWINQEIKLKGNKLENQEVEYEAQFDYEEARYLFSGKIPKEEFTKIIKNINFE